MSVEQAAAHPAAQALTRAVGAAEPLTLDVLELAGAVPAMRLCSAATVCISGLSSSCAWSTPSAWQRRTSRWKRLFDRALRGAARDNLTAVVIRQ
jgi:serine/threonine-protein phosphatase Stp1